MGTTTITISEDSWKRLNQLKDPGETFEQVISELLESEEPQANNHEDN